MVQSGSLPDSLALLPILGSFLCSTYEVDKLGPQNTHLKPDIKIHLTDLAPSLKQPNRFSLVQNGVSEKLINVMFCDMLLYGGGDHGRLLPLQLRHPLLYSVLCHEPHHTHLACLTHAVHSIHRLQFVRAYVLHYTTFSPKLTCIEVFDVLSDHYLVLLLCVVQ